MCKTLPISQIREYGYSVLADFSETGSPSRRFVHHVPTNGTFRNFNISPNHFSVWGALFDS